jgi:hypothetical protein
MIKLLTRSDWTNPHGLFHETIQFDHFGDRVLGPSVLFSDGSDLLPERCEVLWSTHGYLA